MTTPLHPASPDAVPLTLAGIEKRYGDTPILKGVDLRVRPGEFLTLVGPSGCGKSTMLRIIAGLEPQDAGTVTIGDTPVDRLRPSQRNVAMVFQNYALYPHMTVRGNIATPLMMQRLSLFERLPLLGRLSPRRRGIVSEIDRAVREVAAQIQIEALLDRKPAQLSGGQRQRVALGRAMVRRPSLFLMDEPLSNLDAKLRVHMRSELADLHRRLGRTFIYVTHDQVEAMTMSDRVAMMHQGEVLQLGTPAELYERPADLTVARFIGNPPINVLPAVADGQGGVELEGARLPLPCRQPQGTPVSVGIRPEALSLAEGPSGGAVLPVRLHRTENLGSEWLLYFDVTIAEAPRVCARLTSAEYEAAQASGVLARTERLRIDVARAHVFGPDGRREMAPPSVEPLRARA